MSKKLLEDLKEKLEPSINELGYELVDIEFVTEMGERYLRFYIYHPDGIHVDDCETVSNMLDIKLDELDLISSSYYLEVSSPDLSRPLKTDRDLERNLGQILDFNLYRKVDNKKEYQAVLKDFDDEKIVLDQDGKIIELDRKDISKISIAIIF